MALRVSLQIDGDSSGAEQAAKAASDAVKGLGKEASAAAMGLEEAFKKASGAYELAAFKGAAYGAVNDNLKADFGSFVGLLDQVAQKTLGADNAFAKMAAGVSNVSKGVAAIGPMVGTVGLLSGGFGIAATAASAFFSIVNSGSDAAAIATQNQEQLVDKLRAAYSGAAKEAKKLYDATRDLRIVQLGENIDKLKSQRGEIVDNIVSDFEKRRQAYSSDFFGLTGQRFTGFDAQKTAFDKLAGSIKSLRSADSDVSAVQQQFGAVARAAGNSGSEIFKAANQYGSWLDQVQEIDKKIRDNQNGSDYLKGTATPKQVSDFFNQGKAAAAASTEFDRMTKALSRQIVVQEAEAATVGKSAGEQNNLRTKLLLVEAAHRDGIDPAGKYAAAIDAIAGRAGATAQKLAEMQIRSNAAFDLSQIGRSAGEQNIASILRGAYGDNVEAYMNGAIAGTLRFNAAMVELKGTTLDAAQGAFRDFRTELMNGAGVWDAFGKAGVNALQRIADKLADKSIDNLISNMFGSFLGSGSGGLLGKLMGTSSGAAVSAGTIGGTGGILGGFYAAGGFTGVGEKFEPAGIVHRGEYVFSSEAVNSIGLGNLDAIHRASRSGYASGGPVGMYAGLTRSTATSFTTAPVQIIEGDSTTNIAVQGDANEKTLAAIRAELDLRDRRRRASYLDDLEAGFKKLQADWRVR